MKTQKPFLFWTLGSMRAGTKAPSPGPKTTSSASKVMEPSSELPPPAPAGDEGTGGDDGEARVFDTPSALSAEGLTRIRDTALASPGRG